MLDYFPFLRDKPFLFKIGYLVLIIALSMVLSMIIGLILALPFFGTDILSGFSTIDNLSDKSTVAFLKYFQVVNQIGVFILPAILYAYLESRNAPEFLMINRKPKLSQLLLSVFIIVSSIPAINWMVGINEQMHLPDYMRSIETWMRENEDKTNLLTETFLSVNSIGGLVVNLFIIALMAAIGEELLFRGVVFRLLLDWLKNPHLAVILSSILFSALHLQFFGFLPRMVLGLLFGYIYLWTGSLWIPVILHFLFNGATVVVAYLYNIGLISTNAEQFGSTDNTLIIITSFIISIGLLVMLRRNNRDNFGEIRGEG